MSTIQSLDGDLLTARQAMTRLGLRKSAFYKHEKAKRLDHLQVKRPLGPRRYSRVLIDRFLAGESTVKLGGHRS